MERDGNMATMNMATKALVDRVLTALYTRQPPTKVAMAATGGGASASELLFRGGSSSTMLHFAVPYARASLLQFVSLSASSESIPKFVSQEMAENMARASFRHAQSVLWDQESEENAAKAHSVDATLLRVRSAIGVGCTAALATNYERRGANHAFISICRVDQRSGSIVEKLRCETYHLSLDKAQARSREQEDRLVSQFVVYLLGKAGDVATDDCAELLASLEQQELRGDADKFEPFAVEEPKYSSVGQALGVLSSQTLTNVAFLPVEGAKDAAVVQDFPFRGIVLSGSFNPLHQGHVDLALAAQRLVQTTKGAQLPVAFEIAVANADKGAIDTTTVVQRVQQFTRSDEAVTEGKWPVLVTNATLFSQKAELLQGCVFVIGADTAVRLVDKKYYDQDDHKMVLALRQIAANGGSFVVAGRFDEKDSKRFISADEVLEQHIPSVLKDMFVALREEDFRNDLSSTQIRNALKAKAMAS